MHLCDYLMTLKDKWIQVQVDSGSMVIYQGVLQEIGDDYIIIKDNTAENPQLLTLRHIIGIKEMRVKENGKPRIFG
ncbi:hypothetical protein SAMN06296952_2768 [Oscillospiraceae bacterium]|nr:hypothetical protein SAMN06296952_2768 [Oscillospiraceae bacterium]